MSAPVMHRAYPAPSVMAGLVPAIHAAPLWRLEPNTRDAFRLCLSASPWPSGVDGQDEPGHDLVDARFGGEE